MRIVEAFKHVAVLIREELRQVHFSLPIKGHEFGTFFWMAVSSSLIRSSHGLVHATGLCTVLPPLTAYFKHPQLRQKYTNFLQKWRQWKLHSRSLILWRKRISRRLPTSIVLREAPFLGATMEKLLQRLRDIILNAFSHLEPPKPLLSISMTYPKEGFLLRTQ